MTDVIAAFSADQVKELTGLSVNRLRMWDRDEFFTPSLASPDRSEPFSRVYTFEDVVGLRTLSILRATHKVSRQHLRKAAVKLKKHAGKPWSQLTLYVLNGEVHFKNPSTGSVEGAISGQFAVPIELGNIADDMRAKAERLKVRDSSNIGHVKKNKFTMRGRSVLSGTRIPVATIKRFAEAGYTPEQIIREFPSLTFEDVQAAIDYKDNLTRVA